MSWPEAAAKARYVLKLYVAGLAPDGTRHRDLVAAILEDFVRLTEQGLIQTTAALAEPASRE
jgi:hypothetical protein